MLVDEVASGLEPPWGFRASSAGDVGVETAGNFGLWRRDIETDGWR